MGLYAQPVHPALEQGETARGLGLHKCFALAFFALASCLGNEQAPIAERTHEIRQILVRLALEHVVDPIGSPKVGYQAVSRGACRASIAALVETHMGMIL